jgi:hypothetical protein
MHRHFGERMASRIRHDMGVTARDVAGNQTANSHVVGTTRPFHLGDGPRGKAKDDESRQ